MKTIHSKLITRILKAIKDEIVSRNHRFDFNIINDSCGICSSFRSLTIRWNQGEDTEDIVYVFDTLLAKWSDIEIDKIEKMNSDYAAIMRNQAEDGYVVYDPEFILTPQRLYASSTSMYECFELEQRLSILDFMIAELENDNV